MEKHKEMRNSLHTQEELERIEIQLLLEGIYRYYGYDFRDYAFSSIYRRAWYRVRAEKLTSITGLLDKILREPNCMERLFADFSITVTEMFRDPNFFMEFRAKVVPKLKKYPAVRIWHAGCSTGEEVLSMAILLYEEGLYPKTRIYATDMNGKVLENAKKGVCSVNKMRLYTQNYLQAGGTRAFSEYYMVKDKNVVFHPFLNENVVYAQHNLASDGSFNEFQVIVCRNVLIYFNQALQERVQGLFYNSLSLAGFLGLGSKEGITNNKYSSSYERICSKENLYSKIK